MGLLCSRSDIEVGSSIAPLNSRTIVLLASRSSRKTLPTTRITSGSRSGGITINATTNTSNISTILKGSSPTNYSTMIVNPSWGVNDAQNHDGG